MPKSTGLKRRAFLAALLSCAACRERASTGPTQRLVSLSPSTTEAIFALGAGDRLVGRSEHCDYPEEVKRVPSVGGYATPNFEAIIALSPTLVIGEQGPVGPEIENQLNAHGVATFFPPTDSVADIIAMLRSLGARLDAATAAERQAHAIEERVASIQRWTEGRPRVTLVMVFDASPLFVAGPGSFPDELIRLAGGKNLIARGGKWPTVDMEHLMHLDPDVIVDAMGVGHGRTTVGSGPGWQELRAVKEGRVRRLGSATPLRPGPRIADGLAEVATAIHGQAPP